MTGVLFLIPLSIFMGLVGLAAFLLSLHHNQFEDLQGDSERILIAPDQPINLAKKEQNNG